MHFCQFEVFIVFFFVFILCLSFVWSFFHVISIPDIRLDGLWLAMTYRDGNVRWEFIASTFVAEESMYALWLWFFFLVFPKKSKKNVILQGSMYVESHFIDRNSTQKYKIYPRIELRQSPQFSSLKVEARMRTEARFAIHFCLHAKRLITKQQQL